MAHIQAALVALPAGKHNNQGHWSSRVVGMAQPHNCQMCRPTHECSSEIDGPTRVLHGDYYVPTSGCCECWRHFHVWMLLRPTIRCAPKSPYNVHVPVRDIRSIGDDDDNHQAWDLEPVSSGMATGVHPGGLYGQRDFWHPPLGLFLVYYNTNSVPPYPEPSLRVLVSSKCAVNPYPILVLVWCCQSPLSSPPAVETHYSLVDGVLVTFLHKPWLQCRTGCHKHQGSNTYHSIRATWN
jgi:hypothetical protein